MNDWQNLVIGAYYGCEISILSPEGAIQTDAYFWWNGSGWVEGRLPKSLWPDHDECRNRYRFPMRENNE